jgi:predicted HTH domain antitoxin
MSLSLVLDLPPEIEERLRRESRDVTADAREAFVVELYRRGTLSRMELGQVLGLDRIETEALLKRRHVFEGSLTMADLENDSQTLEKLFRKGD